MPERVPFVDFAATVKLQVPRDLHRVRGRSDGWLVLNVGQAITDWNHAEHVAHYMYYWTKEGAEQAFPEYVIGEKLELDAEMAREGQAELGRGLLVSFLSAGGDADYEVQKRDHSDMGGSQDPSWMSIAELSALLDVDEFKRRRLQSRSRSRSHSHSRASSQGDAGKGKAKA
jgi:hypothetical protein